jgi:hypothetical protein
MSSQTLQIGDSSASPSFVQQGQVDWAAFANSTVSASISVMQRFSAAGVQPVTVAGGLALGSRFELGKKGSQNMDVALKNLNGVFGYDKLLYYGFGYRSFVNILAETKVGVNLVALCACLVDMHGVQIAADVLAALWKLEAFPAKFEPAISQFNAIATACAGVVAATTFGQIGDIMLGDLRKLIPGKSVVTGFPMGSISNTDDIAKVLHGLFQLSRGTLEYIDVVGGANCSFIAAFAHWLLDLTLYVEDDTGILIYQNTSNRESAQVRIRYCSLDQASTELHLASTTYVLGSHDAMLIHTPWEDKLSLIVRTPWDGCLERVFWNSTQRLKGLSQIWGEFLGSAARIYAALARGEADVGDFSRNLFSAFAEGTYGHEFVKSVESIFPELGRVDGLGSVMLKASNTSFTQAMSNIQMAIKSLTRLCECNICKKLTHRHFTKNSLKDKDCIVVTTMTITSIVRLVAGLEIDDMVKPTITGLEQLYRRCFHRMKLSWGRNQLLIIAEALDLPLKQDPPYGRTPQPTPASLMADVQCLFTGYRPTQNEIDRNNHRVAFSYNGICCYLESLRGLSSSAAVLRRIHVLPGCIRREDQEYTAVWDCTPSPQPQLPKATLEMESHTPPTEFRDDKIVIKALVTEVSGGGQLIFYYQAMFEGVLVRIRPGMLTQRVLEGSGLITCDKRTCSESLVFPYKVIQEGWNISEYREGSEQLRGGLTWPFREGDIGRCVAIELASADNLYVRQGECLSCCNKAASHDLFAMIV